MGWLAGKDVAGARQSEWVSVLDGSVELLVKPLSDRYAQARFNQIRAKHGRLIDSGRLTGDKLREAYAPYLAALVEDWRGEDAPAFDRGELEDDIKGSELLAADIMDASKRLEDERLAGRQAAEGNSSSTSS